MLPCRGCGIRGAMVVIPDLGDKYARWAPSSIMASFRITAARRYETLTSRSLRWVR